jgi:hypothetical protein
VETGVNLMRTKLFSSGLMLIVVAGQAWPQAAQQNLTFTVKGQPGQASVLQMNGRSYVDIESLARLTNGSLGFQGNQITLQLPASAPASAPPASQPASSEFSKEFLKAGIEEMSIVREWRSALCQATEARRRRISGWLLWRRRPTRIAALCNCSVTSSITCKS